MPVNFFNRQREERSIYDTEQPTEFIPVEIAALYRDEHLVQINPATTNLAVALPH
jgi:hypothetical protein